MALNDQCIRWLEEWQFEEAENTLDDKATPRERETVEALARMFGDVAGLAGDMEILVRNVVNDLNAHDRDE